MVGACGERYPDLSPPARSVTRREAKRTSWEIRDSESRTVAVHVRYQKPDGDKGYAWERPDGRRGLDGLPVVDLPLYGTELLPMIPADELLLITEGEKSCDAARRLGFYALATVTGASLC